ncbi:hypothetical protein X747_05890 [Mesorhizobium sp. LNJC384A00]|uniref:hypothetical protein n=1 Tax=Mesorhizobium sp. LNJC384A00 TaxID=1287268 RepID=UPI0003CE3073|nr:hypothetical protein [Mesorhizobium sp. LNJC384A00]ESY43419.1 hypothetical protein X747_05890 [Mesorhizobium sp. LNJC384A00]
MLDDDERLARQEAFWLLKEFGAEAPLFAAMKAEKAIEQKDFGRCARWKRILDILADSKPAASVQLKSAGAKSAVSKY